MAVGGGGGRREGRHTNLALLARTALPGPHPAPPSLACPSHRKCYYPGALTLYAELDRRYAKRYGPTLERLRETFTPPPPPEGDEEGGEGGESPTAAGAAPVAGPAA